MAEAAFAQDQGGTDDIRNAALLVDPLRREFLASLDALTVNSYAVLYARAEKWVAYARRGETAAKGKAERSTDAAEKEVLLAESERWARLKERWELSVRWLDRNLTMSGSIRGKRAEQLVDVLAGSREAPSMGGAAVVYPATFAAPPAPSKKMFGR